MMVRIDSERKMTEVRCGCRVCGGQGALVRGEGTFGGKKITPTAAHNLVRLAHSPLARSASCTATPLPAERSAS